MQHCIPSGKYQNLFLTVPDRGFDKEQLVDWINAWRKDYIFLEIAREPYSKPGPGFTHPQRRTEFTHHFHAGLVFQDRVRIGKFVKACNKSKLFLGMDFRIPLVKKGASAVDIFRKYFHNPSKYKALDEEPLLVRNRGPAPCRAPSGITRRQWEDPVVRAAYCDRVVKYYEWACS